MGSAKELIKDHGGHDVTIQLHSIDSSDKRKPVMILTHKRILKALLTINVAKLGGERGSRKTRLKAQAIVSTEDLLTGWSDDLDAPIATPSLGSSDRLRGLIGTTVFDDVSLVKITKEIAVFEMTSLKGDGDILGWMS